MCIAIPARIVSIDGFSAIVERYGRQFTVSLAMLSDDVCIDDYVIVQAERYATQRIDRHAAEEAYRLFETFAFDRTAADRPDQ